MEAHVGLGGPPDLLSMRVLPALRPLYEAGVFIRIRPGRAEQLLEQLEDHTLDMFVATRKVNSATTPVVYEPLFEEEYVLVGDSAWHARVQDALAPGDTREEIEHKTVAVLAGAPFLAFDDTLPVIRDHPLVAKHRNAIFTDDSLKQVPLIVPDFRALREVADDGLGRDRDPALHRAGRPARAAAVRALRAGRTAATTRFSSPTATSRAARSPTASSPACGRAPRSGRSARARSPDAGHAGAMRRRSSHSAITVLMNAPTAP